MKDKALRKFARWLRTFTLKEVEVENPTIENDGITPWDKARQECRDYWVEEARQILNCIKEI